MKKQRTPKASENRTTIVLDPAVKEVGRKLAKADRRSLSKFIEQLINDAHRKAA